KTKANLFSLDFHAEQVPNPESRIGLGNETDALGIPRIHVDWRYSPQDVATVAKSVELLASDLKSSGAGTLSYDPGTIEAEMTRYGAYGGHHVGTARMGDDPRSSVVDRNCRVHGVDNLYIASAATLPT
ncbi:MAG: GMC family oxidoreductase, partial [Hyphomicrobium sp.]|nr:GMC family oxidoreductase [Hyphomicrobium sp.]